MYVSLATLLLNIAKDSPILYGLGVIGVMALVALIMHHVLEVLFRMLKL